MFAQALTTTPHLFSSGLFRMEYEHLSRSFILEDPSLRVLKLFQAIAIVARTNFLRSMALMLRANILLAMEKNTGGFHPIVVGDMFIQFISHSIVLQL